MRLMYSGFLWCVTPLTRFKRRSRIFQGILSLWETLLDGRSGPSAAFWGRGLLHLLMQTRDLCYWSFSCYPLIIPIVRNKHSQENSCFQWCFLRYLSLDFMGRLWSWVGKQLSSWNSQQTQVCLSVSQLFLGNGSHLNPMQRGDSPVLYSEYLICYLFVFFCVSSFYRFFLLVVF